ncbi:tRNA lysidine(34) synthetase TilS [Desulfoluna spongiiphila]|uniref:tRNA lysidine(34) synthetase TilS n=1 Tax=Desulfoluna spongiiphila TaxID=419481 RepID=UPI001252B4C0|nr:tRNA lysidine(34) synthetase TilS [Desulfoluna spongiiphila]VVS93731.1 trna(ile)-lysidine synthase [Desulfoluna spongiiphila]
MTRHPQTRPVSTVRATLARHAMCLPGDHLLVALSGGADSMALLHILHRLAPELGITLSVAHLNHGIRGEAADRDQLFSQRAAEDLSLACITHTVDVPALARRAGTGLEEAARNARYAFLHEVALSCGARRIAVGHHKGDMAEQLLLNLLRGSGLKGLGAMEPVTADGIIRPLVDLSKDDLAAWLKAEGIGHVTDDSNRDTAYTRNRVRHRLLPMLETEFNPSAVDTLARTAALLREEEDWLREMTESLYTDCRISEEEGHLTLSIPTLSRLHPAAQNRVLRRSVEALCGSTRTLSAAHVQSLSKLLSQGQPGHFVDLSRGLRGILTRGGLHLTTETGSLRHTRPDLLSGVPPFCYTVDRPEPGHPLTLGIEETGDTLTVGWTSAPGTIPSSRNANRVFIDPSAIAFPLTVRNHRPGDRFRPQGGSGSRKIGRFFSDCGVEAAHRSRIPLVLSKNAVIWVAGYRLDGAATPPPPGAPALELVLCRQKKG